MHILLYILSLLLYRLQGVGYQCDEQFEWVTSVVHQQTEYRPYVDVDYDYYYYYEEEEHL